jgi:hypothetical protein
VNVRRLILIVLPLLFASPAQAERLSFDHRLYPAIGAVLDSGRKEMVLFDESDPNNVFDRIAIQGSSAENWTEALEIVVRTRTRAVSSTADWMGQIAAQTAAGCTPQITQLSQDAASVTFMRKMDACASAETALYRIVAGRKSLFLLGARYKGVMTETMQREWLSVLASARIVK